MTTEPTVTVPRAGTMRRVAERIAEPRDVAETVALSILVPVYNEAASLASVLDRLLALDMGFTTEIVVVDDGSTDATPTILAARDHPRLRALCHERNRGKGAAVQTALDAARGDIVVVQDADLEYDPIQLPSLVAPVLSGEVDVVYGSRFLGHARDMTLPSRAANRSLTALTRLLFRTPITDMETCYKVVRRSLIADMRFEAQRFDLEPEITARLLRRRHRILEMPIDYDGRSRAEGKKIGWRDGVQAVRTLVRWRFFRRRP